jgi:hypothetical protein
MTKGDAMRAAIVTGLLLGLVGLASDVPAQSAFDALRGLREQRAPESQPADAGRVLTEKLMGRPGPQPPPEVAPAASALAPPAQAAGAPSSPVSLPAAPLAQFVLLGVVIAGETEMALLQEPGQVGARFVQVGESVAGYRLAGVRADRVTLAGPHGDQIVLLGVGSAPGGGGTVAASRTVGSIPNVTSGGQASSRAERPRLTPNVTGAEAVPRGAARAPSMSTATTPAARDDENSAPDSAEQRRTDKQTRDLVKQQKQLLKQSRRSGQPPAPAPAPGPAAATP